MVFKRPADHWDPPDELRNLLSRLVYIDQLTASVTTTVLTSALKQFGSVKKVVILKDDLNPKANAVTVNGAGAVVEMGSATGAQNLLSEIHDKLLIVDRGPRAVRAMPAQMGMLDACDWPEVARFQAKRRRLLVRASSGTAAVRQQIESFIEKEEEERKGGGGRPSATQGLGKSTALVGWAKGMGAEECRASREQDALHIAETAEFEERKAAEHRALHERHQLLLQSELRKYEETTAAMDPKTGPVRALAAEYGVRLLS